MPDGLCPCFSSDFSFGLDLFRSSHQVKSTFFRELPSKRMEKRLKQFKNVEVSLTSTVKRPSGKPKHIL